jgi:hypothetical protein
MSSKGIISSLTVAYNVFDSTPFFVDEGIIANVVIATKELQSGCPFSRGLNFKF